MTKDRAPKDLAASVRQRLLDRARANGEDFQLLIDRYAVERLLYRLSISEWRDQFLLKGALLFSLWFNAPHRPTRDADFLGFGDADPGRLANIIQSLCAIDCADGIGFEPASLQVTEIREAAAYPGLRATLRADLDGARCVVRLDVGYGDAVTPGPQEVVLPGLIDGIPAPALRAYPRESAFSEKLEAIARFGMANSRMKDYFDLLALKREGAMDVVTLAQAIDATFERRGTTRLETLPAGLSPEFSSDAQKRRDWSAFLKRNRLDAPELADVVAELSEFVQRLLEEAGRTSPGRQRS